MRTVEVTLVNEKGETKTVSVQSNNFPCAGLNATMHNPGWRYRSARFIGPLGNGRRSASEVRDAIRSGRHVSASEVAAYLRSPRGMQDIAMMANQG